MTSAGTPAAPIAAPIAVAIATDYRARVAPAYDLEIQARVGAARRGDRSGRTVDVDHQTLEPTRETAAPVLARSTP